MMMMMMISSLDNRDWLRTQEITHVCMLNLAALRNRSIEASTKPGDR